MPYELEKVDTGEIAKRYEALPPALDLPDGRRVVSPVAVGDEGLGYRLIEVREVDFGQPGRYFTRGADVETRDGNVKTVTREWIPWSQAEIDAYEAARRANIVAAMDDVDDITRAAVLVIKDELNRHSTVIEEIIMAGRNANSLGAFRSSMSAIQPIPQRGAAMLRAAIFAKLGIPDAS